MEEYQSNATEAPGDGDYQKMPPAQAGLSTLKAREDMEEGPVAKKANLAEPIQGSSTVRTGRGAGEQRKLQESKAKATANKCAEDSEQEQERSVKAGVERKMKRK